MQRRVHRTILALTLLLVSTSVSAQESSLNTFSPYTFYGLGDLTQAGTARTSSMGSIGVGVRSLVHLNYLNPAAFSATPRQSFLMNVGMQGYNNYLKNGTSKTSNNTFNLHDVGISFPIYHRIGFGFSLTPYSSVGYKTTLEETDPAIIADLGRVQYRYLGEGDVNELKAGIGAELFKGFSLGANFIYYLGSIERTAHSEITDILSNNNYRLTRLTRRTNVNKINLNVGFQYQYAFDEFHNLTVGMTYQPRVKLNPKEDFIAETYTTGFGDTVVMNDISTKLVMPNHIAIGMYYQARKIGFGVDYNYQNWKKSFVVDPKDNISMTAYQNIKAGMEYTPDRYSVRSVFQRTSYRLGFRYNNSYVMKNNHKIHEYAVTAGVGVPLRIGSWTSIDAGVEIGRRGSTKNGLILENFFKVFIGFSLFGDDLWFVRPKFN